jgi:hypothetical protein
VGVLGGLVALRDKTPPERVRRPSGTTGAQAPKLLLGLYGLHRRNTPRRTCAPRGVRALVAGRDRRNVRRVVFTFGPRVGLLRMRSDSRPPFDVRLRRRSLRSGGSGPASGSRRAPRPPRQVLDDPLGVADRLAVELEHRHPILAGDLEDLRAVAFPIGHAHLLVLQPAALERPRGLAAGAEPVRGRHAAVQDDHRPKTRTRSARPRSSRDRPRSRRPATAAAGARPPRPAWSPRAPGTRRSSPPAPPRGARA